MCFGIYAAAVCCCFARVWGCSVLSVWHKCFVTSACYLLAYVCYMADSLRRAKNGFLIVSNHKSQNKLKIKLNSSCWLAQNGILIKFSKPCFVMGIYEGKTFKGVWLIMLSWQKLGFNYLPKSMQNFSWYKI